MTAAADSNLKQKFWRWDQNQTIGAGAIKTLGLEQN